tara:strand:+ start:173 stop:460 length:288 start_codon:yes stop_codon:yes gene_type:complete
MWCNELSTKIIKECIIEVNNKQVNCLNSNGDAVTKHVNKKDCLIRKSSKKDKLVDNNFEDRDIKLVMNKTKLNRERAIEELQKNDIVTVLMKHMS